MAVQGYPEKFALAAWGTFAAGLGNRWAGQGIRFAFHLGQSPPWDLAESADRPEFHKDTLDIGEGTGGTVAGRGCKVFDVRNQKKATIRHRSSKTIAFRLSSRLLPHCLYVRSFFRPLIGDVRRFPILTSTAILNQSKNR